MPHQAAMTESTSAPFPPFAVTPELESAADEHISHYVGHTRSAVLPLLHEVQHRHGFISTEALHWVAEKLDLQPIKVLEVVSFYPGFRQSAPGRFHFRVCRTLSCAMAGSYELMAKLCELKGIDLAQMHGFRNPILVSDDGEVSVEFAECLAACGFGPICMVNDDTLENVTAVDAPDILEQCRKHKIGGH